MKRFLWFALGVVLVAAGLTLALSSPATEPTDRAARHAAVSA